MRRLSLTVFAWALVAASLGAQSSSKTFFEEKLLDHAPLIVRARHQADERFFDLDVAAYQVSRRLRGEADDRILVLGGSTLAQRRRDIDQVLFLKSEPGGCFHRIVDVIDLVEDADAIEAFIRSFLALAGEHEPVRRRTALKQIILDGLGMSAAFPRKLAARELDLLARRSPPVLTLQELAQFAQAARNVPPEEAARVAQALDAAEDALLGPFKGTQRAWPRGAQRTAYVRAVGEMHAALDPDRRAMLVDAVAVKFGEGAGPFLLVLLADVGLRERALRHLGAMQYHEATPTLLDRLGKATDAAPWIRCLGEIGDDAATPTLRRYLGTAEYFDDAALALARIDSEASRRILAGVLAQLKRDPRQQPRVDTIKRILGAEFREEDLAQRLEARGRYPRE